MTQTWPELRSIDDIRRALRVQQNWRPLWFYSAYRLVLAGLFFVMFLYGNQSLALGQTSHIAFIYTIISYFSLALVLIALSFIQRPGYSTQVWLHGFVDMLHLPLITLSSGGVNSGLGITLVVAVAALGILARGKHAIFFAAMGSTILLLSEGYLYLGGSVDQPQFTRAGLNGLALFMIGYLAHALAERIRTSEAVAFEQNQSLLNLSALNEALIQHLEEGLLVVNPQGHIQLINERAQQLFDVTLPLSSSDQLGKTLSEKIRTLDIHQLPLEFNWEVSHSELRIRADFIGQPPKHLIVLYIQDVDQLQKQFQQSKFIALGRLAGGIAHEIRNPLGAISHASQLLAESPQLKIADQKLLDIILAQSARVNQSIEAILQLSRHQKAEPQKIHLRHWLENTIAELKQLPGASATVKFEIDHDITIFFDMRQLHQIAGILLDNACRHSGLGDKLIITICARQLADLTHIDICDNGPGIPPKVANKIFDPFYSTASRGSGLGLYIARTLCEANGATLGYQPNPSGGSCFRLSTPITRDKG